MSVLCTCSAVPAALVTATAWAVRARAFTAAACAGACWSLLGLGCCCCSVVVFVPGVCSPVFARRCTCRAHLFLVA
eukprot:2390119-Amphidinium_carterae.1